MNQNVNKASRGGISNANCVFAGGYKLFTSFSFAKSSSLFQNSFLQNSFCLCKLFGFMALSLLTVIFGKSFSFFQKLILSETVTTIILKCFKRVMFF